MRMTVDHEHLLFEVVHRDYGVTSVQTRTALQTHFQRAEKMIEISSIVQTIVSLVSATTELMFPMDDLVL